MAFFTKKEQIAILSIVFIIVTVFGVKVFLNQDSNKSNLAEIKGLIINENIEDAIETPKELIIHVSGEVNTPGIYRMYEGDRVIDAIKKAGGFTTKAYQDGLNLAKKVYDEEKIVVPILGENSTASLEFSNNQISGKININTCTKEQLILLPGIGDVIADRIIAYRKDTRFSKIEDILNVSGIGDAKFEGIKDLISVN